MLIGMSEREDSEVHVCKGQGYDWQGDDSQQHATDRMRKAVLHALLYGLLKRHTAVPLRVFSLRVEVMAEESEML